ncbi:alpha-amylase family glycosyl hydrolase [Arcanobacterium canis]
MKKSLAVVAAVTCVLAGCSGGTKLSAGDQTISIDGVNYPVHLAAPAHIEVKNGRLFTADIGEGAPRATAPYQSPSGNEQFYFVMTDRFANADPSNDRGGISGDKHQTGFDPTDMGYYLGGDIAGLEKNLDYIKGLGTTAIWITPPFKNKPVQGDTASYHGYWIQDFTSIDPHYGTKEEMKHFIDTAHSKGMKVYFDIITNHTADIISYKENDTTYVPLQKSPYQDANGNVIDVSTLAGKTFPRLDPNRSFPYTPQVKEKKLPDWLNDVTLYHNRGNSTFEGESSTMGDFGGLDDVMTENPKVVQRMADIYTEWMKLGIDGFRIDTVKHVNFEFWQEFMEKIAKVGGDKFFSFGEVYDTQPATLASYPRKTKMNSVLDFAFQAAVTSWAKGGPASRLSSLFKNDALYTTAHSSAGDLPTFLGNHDMGRASQMVGQDPKAFNLAYTLMFLTRGQPVVYYGDEQGFVGGGKDKLARQPLFATQVEGYRSQKLLDGSDFGAGAHMSTDTAQYRLISTLGQLRRENRALSDGAQFEQLDDAGVYAFSRLDPREGVEYLVIVNNAESTSVTVPTLTSGEFSQVWALGDAPTSVTASDKGADVKVPEKGAVVYKAQTKVPVATGAPMLRTADDGKTVTLTATLKDGVAPVSFAWRAVGTDQWHSLGSAYAPEATVIHDVSGEKENLVVEYRATNGTDGTSVIHILGGPDQQ